MEYKINTIYHAIYVKLFSNSTVSYLTVSMEDIPNTTNNGNNFMSSIMFSRKPLKPRHRSLIFLNILTLVYHNRILDLVLIRLIISWSYSLSSFLVIYFGKLILPPKLTLLIKSISCLTLFLLVITCVNINMDTM